MHLEMLLVRAKPRRERIALTGLSLTLGMNLVVQFTIAILPQATY